jgi:predicted ATPase
MTQTADRPPQNAADQSPKPVGFTEIGVSGFKSFAEETRIQLGSLTILAGANSSGKSSIMQPLLLMKQTLEAPYDPGALRLDGPNVSFTSSEQFISKFQADEERKIFTILLSSNGLFAKMMFQWTPSLGIDICGQSLREESRVDALLEISPDMSDNDIQAAMKTWDRSPFFPNLQETWKVERNRCFLKLVDMYSDLTHNLSNSIFTQRLTAIIHVPGLREGPQRLYKTAAVSGLSFVGQFENYVANIIDRFQKEDLEKLVKLQQSLQKLGLTDLVQTQRLNDTQIELRVGRILGQADPTDTVNIADVGFGVSQVLPVIVALLVAQPGQLVYIEQPEIHLHPRAQIALSEIFADAANRGVRVVVETHSELFLLGVQSLVAEDKLDPKEVKLHWFTRNPDGSSKVISAELDEAGAFGDWPEDFGTTALALENRYLSAAEAKLWNAGNGRSPN